MQDCSSSGSTLRMNRKIERKEIDGVLCRPCTQCKKYFPDGPKTRCPECTKIYHRKWNKENRDKMVYTGKRRRIIRSVVKGVNMVTCSDCGELVKDIKGESKQGRCMSCHRLFVNRYYADNAGKNKVSRKENKLSQSIIDRQLAGEMPISGLFSNVPYQTRLALQSGDFKAFMAATE